MTNYENAVRFIKFRYLEISSGSLLALKYYCYMRKITIVITILLSLL